MTFKIKNLIIHKIDKERPKKGEKQLSATLKTVNSVTPTKEGDKWHRLLETVLNKTNTDRRLRRGNFIDTKGFKDAYDDYKASKQNFVDLTITTTNDLAREMDKETMATGGFILFAEIAQNNTDYFYCIMFKQKMAEDLEFDDSTGRYVLKDVIFLDLDKMHQGFCLEVDDYNLAKNNQKLFDETGKPYLYFINMQSNISGTNTANYFINTFKCRVVENSAKSMKILQEKTVALFENEPNLKPFTINVKNKIKSYYAACEKNHSNIKLSEIETIIKQYTDKANIINSAYETLIDQWFTDLVHSSKHPISAEFPVDTKTLEAMNTCQLTVGGFKFSGNKKVLLDSKPGDSVYYDRPQNKIIISLDEKIN